MVDRPKYPVVDADPSWGRVFTNMNVGDVMDVAGFTAAGFGVGFFGSSKKLKMPMARFNMGIGLMAGLCFAAMSSSQRLIGVSQNTVEVARYGARSNAETEIVYGRQSRPNVELIDDGFGPNAK